MIQIWSLDTSISEDFGTSTREKKGRGMRFDLALLTDFEAIQLLWCPRGGAEESDLQDANGMPKGHGTPLERLGLLAALSTQGIVQILDIPKPESARGASSAAADDLVFSKPGDTLLHAFGV